MNKTVKIARPKFPRNNQGPSGRVEHDSRGNAIWTRSRAEDPTTLPDTAALTIVNDAPPKPPGRSRKDKS
jgi:hypothetical protein